jgi:hypothetical protein
LGGRHQTIAAVVRGQVWCGATGSIRPYDVPYNRLDRHFFWSGQNVDVVLVEHGYKPRPPPRGAPWHQHYILQSPLVRSLETRRCVKGSYAASYN